MFPVIHCLGVLAVLPVCAAAPDLTDRAWDHFYNLEYDQALEAFEADAANRPDAASAHNHIAQTLLFREMYRVGALESEMVSGNDAFLRREKLRPSETVETRFHAELARSMEISQARIEKNPKDTLAMYDLGIAHGLRSNYNFLVRRAWTDALRDATAGRKLHNKVTEIEPGNVDARMMQGMHDYIVGNLPFFYKMMGFLVGFRGDKEEGLRTLELVAKKGEHNRVDAEVILAVLYRREKRYQDAVVLLDDLIRRFPRNYLLWFERGQMYSALGDKQRALGAIQAVADRKRKGVKGFARVPEEKIAYQLGTIQFWYNDLEQALQNFKVVAATAKDVDLNTEVLTWMRIGQIYDLTDRRQQAREAYEKAITAAPNAQAARESKRYLRSPYRREKA
jgi:tetratricopeptide (TPR) repeat protein